MICFPSKPFRLRRNLPSSRAKTRGEQGTQHLIGWWVMNRKYGKLLLVLLAWAPVYAATTGAISGVIKNNTGAPQMGAVVEISTSAATLGTTVFTDAKGFYRADNLPAGTYQVKVSAASFLPSLRENVTLRAGTRLIVNLTL